MIKRGNLQSELNQYQVIRLLRNRGHVTRPELVRETGLSRPTIDKIVELYKGERIIRETGTVDGSSRGGRRPVVLSLDGSTKVLIGIDFECPRLEMVMTDLGSTIIDCRVRTYGPGSQSEKIVDRLIVDIREMLRRNGRTTDELLGIGVALPGVVDVRTGISLNIERLRNWNNVPLSRLIGSSIGVPVFIDNDVNLMALAEKNLGPAEIPNNLIYVAQRQGIGAGILIDGQIFRKPRERGFSRPHEHQPPGREMQMRQPGLSGAVRRGACRGGTVSKEAEAGAGFRSSSFRAYLCA